MTAREIVQQIIVDLLIALLIALVVAGIAEIIAFAILYPLGMTYPRPIYPAAFLLGLLFAFIGLRLRSRKRTTTSLS